jgi:hypothetical protein
LKAASKPCKISFYVIKENQMTVAIATKFTDAETARIVTAYRAESTASTVAALAAELGRSIAAVRGKLVSEKVYISKTATKATAPRETKADILARVEVSLGLAAGTLASLDKGSLDALRALDAATKAE